MLTSVSAFMLSTVFRNKDERAQKVLVVLCLFFLMVSLLMLLAAAIFWIVMDGWSIETVALFIVSIVFLLSPILLFLGKKIGPFQRFWTNNWLPILIAMFVHVTIITTVILIMKKYEYSEDGCASEWPLLHGLFAAVASPFVLCLIVFIYKKPGLLLEQKPARQQGEIAITTSTATTVKPITSASGTASTRSAAANPTTNTAPASAVTSLTNSINSIPSTDTLPSVTPAASVTPTTAPALPDSTPTTATLAISATTLVTPTETTPPTLARPAGTLTAADTPAVTAPTPARHSAGTGPAVITHGKPLQPSTSTPITAALAGTSGWPRRRWHLPAGGVNAASQDLLALMFHDELSGVLEAEDTAVGGLFTDLQSAMADLQASFHTDLHTVHRSMQLGVGDLESKIQTGFTGLQHVLERGIAEHLTAVRTGLGKIQDVLCMGLSDIRNTVRIGLIEGDSSLQKVHTTVLEGLAQISEEADSVVSLLTEVVESQSSAQYSSTEDASTEL
uniref:uncharacterized protein n=1 Tax=Pristiophorus japonicus TaxID=55135 RepID=UPI00398EE6E9